MGRRWKWVSAVTSCLTSNCYGEKTQKDCKSKEKLESGNVEQLDADVAEKGEVRDLDGAQLQQAPSKLDVRPHSAEIKAAMDLEAKQPMREDQRGKHAYSVAVASAVAAEVAAAGTQAEVEVVRFTTVARVSDKQTEEVAAVKIQTAFRGNLAKRKLQSLKRLERLKKLMEGNAIKRQTTNTLYLMKTLSRLQSQIHARRIRIKRENQALQRHLQLKYERELETLKIGEEWDGSMQSKEQIEARIANKHDAAIRRERSLAYAFSHQWKASSRAVTPVFTDTNNPQWGWSWLERWMSARPWENHTTNDTNEHTSIKNTSLSFDTQAQKKFASREVNLEATPVSLAQKPNRSSSRQSPSTPSSSIGRKRFPSPRGTFGSAEDSRSMASLRSDRCKRHSNAGSPSVRDEDSLATSPSVPSYMASTESARAKSRFHTLHSNDGSITSVRKRLSFSVVDK